jgi:hypothetical protein
MIWPIRPAQIGTYRAVSGHLISPFEALENAGYVRVASEFVSPIPHDLAMSAEKVAEIGLDVVAETLERVPLREAATVAAGMVIAC